MAKHKKDKDFQSRPLGGVFKDLGAPKDLDYGELNIAMRKAQDEVVLKNMRPMVEDKYQLFDSWINKVANVGINNSIIKENEFVLNRLGYAQLSSMCVDPIINKAIKIISDEIFSRGGSVVGVDDELLQAEVDDYLVEIEMLDKVRQLAVKALQFGGAFIFIQTTDADLTIPLAVDKDTTSIDRFVGIKVVEPWLVSPASIEMMNPLDNNYMKPTLWFISGAGEVHSSRLIPLTFFEVPDLIKPMFNYQGISLTQLMSEYVANADVMRQSVADLFLRFRTMIIKTNAEKLSSKEYIDRVKNNNLQANNLGVLLINNNEDVQQITTSLSGMDNLISQAMENMVISSSIPATKLLGISPRGFQSTGQFELRNYYDTITNYQNNMIKPIIRKLITYILNLRYNVSGYAVDYIFAPIGVATDDMEVRVKNAQVDLVNKMVNNGLINEDEALSVYKTKDWDLRGVDNTEEEEAQEEDEEFLENLKGLL